MSNTFNAIFGLAGGSDPPPIGSVEFDLAYVSAHAGGQGAVGEPGQLDVVDVAIAVISDVSGGLMRTEDTHAHMFRDAIAGGGRGQDVT